MKNKIGVPQGGNYVPHDIYLIQLNEEDTLRFFHLTKTGNVTYSFSLIEQEFEFCLPGAKPPHRLIPFFSLRSKSHLGLVLSGKREI